jgi:proteasome lid subunit RPN8/RPN11
MNQKSKELEKYSNIKEVQEKAEKLGLNPVGISTKKDKKYMIYDDQGHVKHFGLMSYQDWTKHHDKNRLENFRSRNAAWYHASKYSPAWLSAHLLW